LPDLLEKKSETAIINFSSIYGITACGWACAYSTSKFAVRGFTDTLRQELKNTNILVACVYPGGTKTGIARNAVLAKGTELTPEKIQMAINFEETCLTTPEQAADIIVKGISKNKKRILTGKDAKIMDFIARLKPVHYDNFMFETVLKRKNNKSA
jgi:short-subunit dehydrogenase